MCWHLSFLLRFSQLARGNAQTQLVLEVDRVVNTRPSMDCCFFLSDSYRPDPEVSPLWFFSHLQFATSWDQARDGGPSGAGWGVSHGSLAPPAVQTVSRGTGRVSEEEED